MSDVALDVKGLTKRFAGTVALDRAELSVRSGTVHALLGGNGSGKSTAIKVLAGVHQADEGQLTVAGVDHPLAGFTPRAARVAGLRFVHQDLGLFDGLSVAENFAVEAGYPQRVGGSIRWPSLYRRVRSVLENYELDVDPRTPINLLRPPDRTMVAIARALQDQEGAELVLVLDEPTASLAKHESELLLAAIRRRAELGQTILLVSHRLAEVLSVAHDFTVFRDGRTVGRLCAEPTAPTEDDLIELMAGGAAPLLTATHTTERTGDRELIRLVGVDSGPLRGTDLRVAEGEIVGVAGLVGSGRSTLLRTIFGAHQPERGELRLRGEPFRPNTVGDAMAAGIALVPEDRAGEAAFADLPIRDNLVVSVLRKYFGPRGMPRGAERAGARRLMGQFSIKASGPDALFSSMSGGNQQKTVLARWLQRDPSLLLLDEPTQGVDVMSRADIYRTIRDAARAGCGVVVASSDVTELAVLCDRVVVLRGGRVADELAGPVDADQLSRLVLRSAPAPQPAPTDAKECR